MSALFERILGEFRVSPLRTARALGCNRRILVGRGFRVVGASRIHGRLFAGMMRFGFIDHRRGGLLRVDGTLRCLGHVDVAHGNAWHIAEGATVVIGDRTMFSPGGLLFARNHIRIGARCAIGWDTQILDDNQHPMTVGGVERHPSGTVTIGDHVWVGSRATILMDTIIGDDCVIAAGAIVKGDFAEPNCLIGGVPARVIRRGVTWRFDRDNAGAPDPVLRDGDDAPSIDEQVWTAT